MAQTGTSQSELSRLSGVHQPSISQFLSGKVDLSDDLLTRLLSCMGYCLEVERRPVAPDLTRSERRSWLLHRQLAMHLTPAALPQWQSQMAANLAKLRGEVRGQPHTRNVQRWTDLAAHGDVAGIRRVLTGLSRDEIEMREVSPMAGLLPDAERRQVLASQ
jgi:transcriptional regulator with XRE-family HTH domain